MGHIFSCVRPHEEQNIEDLIRRHMRSFTFSELANACNNFRNENIIGRGSSAVVYKGRLPPGEFIAAKVLNQYRRLVDREFGVEVNMLSRLRHQNLIRLVGYCSERNHRIVVYEFMPLGSLETLLHRPIQVMDWETRVKIAADMSRGLNYLHNQTRNRVIYRGIRSSNVLLGDGFHAKLSDLGHANFGLGYAGPRISGLANAASRQRRLREEKGYCAPEYAATGTYTIKSEVYSFGVLLLELITGAKPSEMIQGDGTNMLINWARLLWSTPHRLLLVADILMKKDFSEISLQRAFEVTLMCLEDDPNSRPDMFYVMVAFDRLAEEGQTRSSRVFEVGETSGSRVFEVGETSGSRVLEEGQTSGSRVFEEGQASGSQVLEEEEKEGGGEETKLAPRTPREETEHQLRRIHSEPRLRTESVVEGEYISMRLLNRIHSETSVDEGHYNETDEET